MCERRVSGDIVTKMTSFVVTTGGGYRGLSSHVSLAARQILFPVTRSDSEARSKSSGTDRASRSNAQTPLSDDPGTVVKWDFLLMTGTGIMRHVIEAETAT